MTRDVVLLGQQAPTTFGDVQCRKVVYVHRFWVAATAVSSYLNFYRQVDGGREGTLLDDRRGFQGPKVGIAIFQGQAVVGGNKGIFQNTQIIRLNGCGIQSVAKLEFHYDRFRKTDSLAFAQDRIELVDFH